MTKLMLHRKSEALRQVFIRGSELVLMMAQMMERVLSNAVRQR